MMSRRISTLTLDGFRGFRAQRTIDLDADLIVLIGPNGSGKTSVVEALELAVTGRVLNRVEPSGEKAGAPQVDGSHLVNQGQGRSAAEVALQLASESAPLSVTLDATDDRGSGAWCDGSEAWRPDGRRRFLRGALFFYADGLRTQLGLEQATEQLLLDLLTPDVGVVQSESIDQVRRRGREVMESLRAAAPGDREGAEQQLGERAYEFEQAWMSACSRKLEPLTRKTVPRGLRKQGVEKRLAAAITQEFELEDSDAPSASDDIRQLLQDVGRLAEERQQHVVDAAQGTSKKDGPAPTELVLQLLDALPDPCPTLAEVESRLEEPGSHNRPEQYTAADNEIQRLQAVQRGLVGELPDALASEFMSREMPTYRVGAIPTLATLVLWRRGNELPHAEPFTTRLREAAPDDPESLFEQAVEQFRANAAAIREQRDLQARLTAEEQQQERDRELGTRLRQLHQLWAQLDDAPVPEQESQLDLDRVRAAARSAHRTEPASVDPGKWQRLAAAARSFREAYDHWLTEDRRYREAASHAKRIDELAAFLDWTAQLGSGNKRDPLQQARLQLFKERFDRQLGETFRDVLSRFTHTREVRGAGLTVTEGGNLRLSVRDANASGNTLLSLSASQRQSITLALALTGNLATPEMPFGFICLDDVADSFDLHNIAADASILRHLAYGTGGEEASDGRVVTRQVLVTVHNEDTANRLLPLLLPPKRRSLRVIEFKPYEPTRGIDFRVWTGRGDETGEGGSDAPRPTLRDMLPPLTADEV